LKSSTRDEIMASVHLGTYRSGPRVDDLPPAPERQLTREELERNLLSLYEQLLATRLDLIEGAGLAEGQLRLSRGELDSVLARLDSAIDAARGMVSSAVRTPRDPRAYSIPVRRIGPVPSDNPS
jgi:hypothetical protein